MQEDSLLKIPLLKSLKNLMLTLKDPDQIQDKVLNMQQDKDKLIIYIDNKV
ncbi:unnamed protein product [Paramecium pentaurelia]|uniref:Uncharacterized protein n=1 Tax=Paramecium pentaurelia TaxID=43138 RepID=A0A8S1V4B7_9CILI|nr:unnamed protein product [Paramecium pentaurelia]